MGAYFSRNKYLIPPTSPPASVAGAGVSTLDDAAQLNRTFEAFGVGASDRAYFRRRFASLDVSRSGRVPLFAAATKRSANRSLATIANICQCVVDGGVEVRSGIGPPLSVNAFVKQAFALAFATEVELRQLAFSYYDDRRVGKMSVSNMMRLVKELHTDNSSFSSDMVNAIFDAANEHGFVSFELFAQLADEFPLLLYPLHASQLIIRKRLFGRSRFTRLDTARTALDNAASRSYWHFTYARAALTALCCFVPADCSSCFCLIPTPHRPSREESRRVAVLKDREDESVRALALQIYNARIDGGVAQMCADSAELAAATDGERRDALRFVHDLVAAQVERERMRASDGAQHVLTAADAAAERLAASDSAAAAERLRASYIAESNAVAAVKLPLILRAAAKVDDAVRDAHDDEYAEAKVV